jgi:AcrR family transcriptional regulator
LDKSVITRVVTVAGGTGADRMAERRASIIGAGLDLLGGSEGDQLTVRRACQQARLTTRYFYESFADRDELVAAVCEHVVQTVAAATLAAVEAAGPRPEAKIDAGLTQLIRGHQRSAARAGAVLRHPGQPPSRPAAAGVLPVLRSAADGPGPPGLRCHGHAGARTRRLVHRRRARADADGLAVRGAADERGGTRGGLRGDLHHHRRSSPALNRPRPGQAVSCLECPRYIARVPLLICHATEISGYRLLTNLNAYLSVDRY